MSVVSVLMMSLLSLTPPVQQTALPVLEPGVYNFEYAVYGHGYSDVEEVEIFQRNDLIIIKDANGPSAQMGMMVFDRFEMFVYIKPHLYEYIGKYIEGEIHGYFHEEDGTPGVFFLRKKCVKSK